MTFDLLKQALSRPIFKDIKFENKEATTVPIRQLQINPIKCPGGLCRVPPHPDLRKALVGNYRKEGKGLKPYYEWATQKGQQPLCPTTRIQAEERATRRSISVATGIAKIAIPTYKVLGEVYLNVLLVKFPDQNPRAAYTKKHYEELLFSKGVLPNGSVHEFYQEVTQGKVSIKGFVSDWLMMPRPKTYYTNGGSATDGAYPRNSQGLVEDAIKVAKATGVTFPPELDFKKNGSVGAFYVFATGRGAEETGSGDDIWSHKGSVNPIQVNADLAVSSYLFVPEDAQIGVCAHELGHLAFEWDDFYDPNYASDGVGWDGAGKWDLMAGGSWNRVKVAGDLPAPPATLHRSQHQWVDVTNIGKTTMQVLLPPQDTKQAKAVVVRSKAYTRTQSLILENRSTTVGTRYDKGLPGGGLLVWKVDTSQYQTKPTNPGMRLLEADQLNELLVDKDGDDGDAGDPFPGATNNRSVSETGKSISTSFGKNRSGIKLENITLDPKTQNITLDVVLGQGMETTFF